MKNQRAKNGVPMDLGINGNLSDTLHLVDLENLVGDPYASSERSQLVLAEYRQIAAQKFGHLAVVAANHHLLDPVIYELAEWSRAHHASGPDGADNVLLDNAPCQWVCQRFKRLVIGSGDHIFADLAEAAITHGLAVTVIGRVGSIARRFSTLGCDIRVLSEFNDGLVAA